MSFVRESCRTYILLGISNVNSFGALLTLTFVSTGAVCASDNAQSCSLQVGGPVQALRRSSILKSNVAYLTYIPTTLLLQYYNTLGYFYNCVLYTTFVTILPLRYTVIAALLLIQQLLLLH